MTMRILRHRLPFAAIHPPKATFSNSAMSLTRWRPPPEPEKPAVPFRDGFRFTARRVLPPLPFIGRYHNVSQPRDFIDFLRKSRFPADEFFYTTTLVDYCSSAALTPLPCKEVGETATFEVVQELAVGDGMDRGGGSQVVACTTPGHQEPLIAKIYDPLYYPFADNDFPSIPNDVVARAEGDFTLESAAYNQLDDTFGGSLVPKFYGSWIVNVPLKHLTRPVGFTLVEYVKGVPLGTLDPRSFTTEERLRVLALVMEAQLGLHFAGVVHEDIAPRNIICSDRNLLAQDLRVRIIDFNFVTILPLLGREVPRKSEKLPQSPLEYFWNRRPLEMREWLPEGWGRPEWNQWLKEKWGTSARFKPVEERLLCNWPPLTAMSPPPSPAEV
jgi:hypothetical protein